MSLRKWLVRGAVFAVLIGLAAGGWLYQRWTNPTAVRQEVLDNLVVRLPGAMVTLEAAHMRLLGGIAFSRLRLARRDDPGQSEFAFFPAGVIYHDKDQLVHGRLAIRKLELQGPRLHARRGPDGRWNLSGILGPVNPEERVPTVVVQDGTLVIEDHAASSDGALEIKDVRLTLLNDPLPVVHFQGTGRCDWLGPVEVSGSWNRVSSETSLSVRAIHLAVGPALVEHLAAYCPELGEHARHLEGTAALDVDLAYHPQAPRPWSHDLRFQLKDGRCSHPQLPLPLEQLACRVRCLDGQVTVEQLTARAGEAVLKLKQARLKALDVHADLDGELEASRLPLDARFFDHAPANLQKIRDDYHPSGHVNLSCAFARRAGRWRYHALIHPDHLTASFDKFPYPLERLTGTLDQEIDPERHLDLLRLDLQGYGSGTKPIVIRGTVCGDAPAAVDIHVTGQDVPLDKQLQDALPQQHQKLAASFRPHGLADFAADIHRDASGLEFQTHYHIRFHHAAARYDVFPYPLEGVAGVLDIWPNRWEFRDFQGTHRGCKVTCRGRSDATAEGDHLVIDIAGQNVLMDPELAAALEPQPELKQAWQQFTPSGRMSFHAGVDCLPARPPQVDVTVTAGEGCAIEPAFFRYALSSLTGQVHYFTNPRGQREVAITGFGGRHGHTVLTLDRASVILKPEGGVWADFHDLGGTPVVADAELVAALPPVLARACTGLRMKDPVGLKVRQLTLDTHGGYDPSPVVYWDGELDFHDAGLYAGVPLEHVAGVAACRGRYNGSGLEGLRGNLLLDQVVAFKQPFRDIHTDLVITKEQPEVLRLYNLAARLYQGTVGGQAHVEFGPVLHYKLDLSALGVDLEAFGRRNLASGDQLSGQASARLVLSGEGEELRNLTGDGRIDVGPNARLYNLPLLLDLFKLLNLRPPDGTAFERAQMAFSIHGPRVLVSQVDLFGNSFSLRGQGEMNLDGTDIHLDFYAIWANVVQMLPPLIKDIPPAISQNLLKIKMRGSVGNVQCIKVPVPGLVDPFRAWMDHLAGRRPADPGHS